MESSLGVLNDRLLLFTGVLLRTRLDLADLVAKSKQRRGCCMRPILYLTLLAFLTLTVACGSGGGGNLPVPSKTTSLRQELTLELERQLKEVSSAGITLRRYVSTNQLCWCLVGDYNLDGVVSISDVTPLAAFFGVPILPVSEFNPETGVNPWWVDGTDEGAVNIQDVTPIAVHFWNEAPEGFDTSVGRAERVGNLAMWRVAIPEGADPEEIEIIPLEHPVLTSVKINPSVGVMQIGEADWFQFEATAYDQYGDSLEVTWIWWVTTPELGTAQEGLFILDPDATPGTYPDVIKAEAQQGEIRVTDSASLVILEVSPPENHPPEITSFSPSETLLEMEIGTAMEFSVEAEDPDGDEVTFTWFLNEEVAGEGGNYTFEATAEGVYEIKVICSDGRGGNDLQSWTLTVTEVSPPAELFLRGIGAPLLENGSLIVLQQGEGASWKPFVILDDLGELVGYADQVEWSSETLPSWVFEESGITTIIWRDPGAGEIEQLLEPGTFDFQVSALFQDQEITLSAALVVQTNPSLP